MESQYLLALRAVLKDNEESSREQRVKALAEIKQKGLPTSIEIRAAVLDALDQGGALRETLKGVETSTRKLLSEAYTAREDQHALLARIKQDSLNNLEVIRSETKQIYANVSQELAALLEQAKGSLPEESRNQLKIQIQEHARVIREEIVSRISPDLQRSKELVDAVFAELAQKSGQITEELQNASASAKDLSVEHVRMIQNLEVLQQQILSMKRQLKEENTAAEEQARVLGQQQNRFFQILFGEDLDKTQNGMMDEKGAVQKLIDQIDKLNGMSDAAAQLILTADQIKSLINDKDSKVDLALKASEIFERAANQNRQEVTSSHASLQSIAGSIAALDLVKTNVATVANNQQILYHQTDEFVQMARQQMTANSGENARLALELEKFREDTKQKQTSIFTQEELQDLLQRVDKKATAASVDRLEHDLKEGITHIVKKQTKMMNVISQMASKMVNQIPQRQSSMSYPSQQPVARTLKFQPQQRTVVQDTEDEDGEEDNEATAVSNKRRNTTAGKGTARNFQMKGNGLQISSQVCSSNLALQLELIKQLQLPPLSHIFTSMKDFQSHPAAVDYVLNLKCGAYVSSSYQIPRAVCVPVIGMTLSSPISPKQTIRLVCAVYNMLFFVQTPTAVDQEYTSVYGDLQLTLLGMNDAHMFIANTVGECLRFYPYMDVVSQGGPSLAEGGTNPMYKDLEYIDGICREVTRCKWGFPKHRLAELHVRVATEICWGV